MLRGAPLAARTRPRRAQAECGGGVARCSRPARSFQARCPLPPLSVRIGARWACVTSARCCPSP